MDKVNTIINTIKNARSLENKNIPADNLLIVVTSLIPHPLALSKFPGAKQQQQAPKIKAKINTFLSLPYFVFSKNKKEKIKLRANGKAMLS